MAMLQGGETQGSQTQGDQTQTMTGHGGQTQEEQNQLMIGHGGQTQGDQLLNSNPTISTPVNVSGVNVNVTVSCCDGKKKHECACDCQAQCRASANALLSLVRTLSLAITDPENALIDFYARGLVSMPTTGNLGSGTACTFTIEPLLGAEPITVLTDALDALAIAQTGVTPSIFSLLLTYLQAQSDSPETKDDECACCIAEIARQLRAYEAAGTQIQVGTESGSFTGYVYRVIDGVAYLVDDEEEPTAIYAIPVCKILNIQPQVIVAQTGGTANET